MAEIQKYSLKQELLKADERLTGSSSILGMTCLTYPNYINAMRATMFTSHLRQFLNLQNPEFPKLLTNAENLVGKYSTGYKRVKHKSTVYRKICKFGDLVETPYVYALFLFDEKKKKFHVETRSPVEDLTENFGYDKNNSFIDGLEEGDEIEAGTVLYKSSSYDDDMNYSYGLNAIVQYTLDPGTSEDAAKVRRGFAEKATSIETEKFFIGLNNNDYFTNAHGDKKNYLPLPKLGQNVNGYIANLRRKFNNQVLFDFSANSLNEIHEGDTVYYVDSENEVIDYTIYNNNEDLQDTTFNRQINQFIKSQNKYYSDIIKTCEEIFESGFDYSRDVDYLYKRAKEMVDTEKKWKEGDSAFSNMVIEVTLRKVVPLNKGSKITGRYGNKSVVSEIVDDEDMPVTEDGRRVDVMLSLLGILNRTTSMVLAEIHINSITWKVRQRMKTFDSYNEKEELLFDIIRMLNEEEYEQMWKIYCNRDASGKMDFIDDAINDGIYIHIPTMWETKPIFYRLNEILQKYDWLKADKLYINKWGRKILALNDAWVGEMYMIKLKQSDRRGFSARSTGAVDTKNLPTRSYKSRSHLEQYSGTDIRFGEFESLNFSIGLLPIDIVLFNAWYRTSIKGRSDIVKLMFNDEEENAVQKIDSSYTSRVAEIFNNVFLKSLSINIEMTDEDNFIYPINKDEITTHKLNGKIIQCTDYEFFILERLQNIKDDVMNDNLILTKEQMKKHVIEELETRNYLVGPSSAEEVKDLIDRYL